MKKTIILLSGGLDSTTTAAIAHADGYELYALSFAYGQRHAVELEAAKRVVAKFGIRHHLVMPIDLHTFGNSALTSDLPVPKDRIINQMGDTIPVTYVPARNTIFLSLALAYAEMVGAADIFIGVNALDYSGYPDCRPEYIAAFETMANLATKAATQGTIHTTIHTPLISLTKAQIIKRGTALGVDYSMTLSCYDPDSQGRACGHCDSCQLRRKGFEESGLDDPTIYLV